MTGLERAAKILLNTLQESNEKGTKPYDTQAEVVRVEGGVAWVHIPGGQDETPVEKTISVKKGDKVQIRVGGGRAWVVGNASAPPTDDTTAREAQTRATEAQTTAGQAQATAEEAVETAQNANQTASNTNQYFWHTETDTGAGAGAHITKIPKDDFLADPSNGGGNTLLTSDGMTVRDGLTELAIFGADGARIGDVNKAHSVIDDKGQRFYAVNGTTQLANIGYDEGNTEGSMDTAPYYTFGVRKTTTAAYSPSSTYSVGDMCVYNERVYVCISEITVPESWYASHWRIYIGNYSYAGGYNTIASGYTSHAEGDRTISLLEYCHAEGYNTKAFGARSHAEGSSTMASGGASHAEGSNTIASDSYSHAEGYGSIASYMESHAQNRGTIASKRAQTALGTWNKEDISTTTTHPSEDEAYGQYAVIVGNGTAATDARRSNALTIDWAGNVEAAGALFSAGAEFSKKTGNHIVVGGIHICWGAVTIAASANTYSESQVTLPYTYQSNPICLASLGNRVAAARTAYATQGSLAGNKIYVGCYSTAARDIYISWMTIGA